MMDFIPWECFDKIENEFTEINKGDIFVYRPTSIQKYYYGVVANATRIHNVPSLHLQFFDYSTPEIIKNQDLSKSPLLIPPVLIRRYDEDSKMCVYDFCKSAWPKAHFKIVGKADLDSFDSIKKAIFADVLGHWLFNDRGEAIRYEKLHQPLAYTFLGEYSRQDEKDLEKLLCYILSLHLNWPNRFGETPLWYIDHFREHLKEYMELQNEADMFYSGNVVPLPVCYDNISTPSRLTVLHPKTGWARYVRQSSRGQFAVIQYTIEPVISEYSILFKNEAQLEECFHGDAHMEREFRRYVYCVTRGILDFVEFKYKEQGVAIGGVKITLNRLQIHEYDSSETAYKITGAILVRQTFFEIGNV